MRYQRNWEIGQKIEIGSRRGVAAGPDINPVWHALLTAPGRERATTERLKTEGVFTFYPIKEKAYRVRGKRFVREFPVVTQIIYARFQRVPQWDVMRDRKLITGVISCGGRPIALPAEIIRAIRGLPIEVRRLEEAKKELMALHPGDRAEIIEGPLAGLLVDVREVRDGRVWWSTLAGLKGQTDDRMLRKPD